MSRFLTRLVLIALTSLVLSSCASFKIATNNGPYEEDYGLRTQGMELEDKLITSKIEVNIKYNAAISDAANIQVHSYNRIVLLTGQVPDSGIKQLATQIAQKVRNVRSVHNELEIGPAVGLNQRSSDNFLKTRVNLRLLADKDVQSGRVDVTVENGSVYLMGLVTKTESQRIVDAARKASGIKKIVKVFEYIDNKLK